MLSFKLAISMMTFTSTFLLDQFTAVLIKENQYSFISEKDHKKHIIYKKGLALRRYKEVHMQNVYSLNMQIGK